MTLRSPKMVLLRNWVGRARADFTSNVSNWTRFSVPFNYYNSTTPTYILLVLTSGDSTIAVNGSQLLLDDLELIYSPSSLNEIDSPIKCWFSNNILHTGINPSLNSYSLNVYDISGKLVLNEQVSSYPVKRISFRFYKRYSILSI